MHHRWSFFPWQKNQGKLHENLISKGYISTTLGILLSNLVVGSSSFNSFIPTLTPLKSSCMDWCYHPQGLTAMKHRLEGTSSPVRHWGCSWGKKVLGKKHPHTCEDLYDPIILQKEYINTVSHRWRDGWALNMCRWPMNLDNANKEESWIIQIFVKQNISSCLKKNVQYVVAFSKSLQKKKQGTSPSLHPTIQLRPKNHSF